MIVFVYLSWLTSQSSDIGVIMLDIDDDSDEATAARGKLMTHITTVLTECTHQLDGDIALLGE